MRFSKALIFPLFVFATCRTPAPTEVLPADSTAPSTETLLRQNDSLRTIIGQLHSRPADTAVSEPAGSSILSRYGLPTAPVELGNYLEEKEALLMPAGGEFGSGLHIETALPLSGNHVFVTGSDGYNYRYWLLQYNAQPGKGLSWKRTWVSTPL